VNANAIWLIPLVAYLLGSIPFGLLIVKASGGGDIRASGSGNIGAANVTRNAGLVAGLLTLLLDAAKGYLAVWIAARWTGSNMRWMMAAAICAVLGHMFPIWLGFRGGKGVATGLGVFLPICAPAVGFALLLWLAVVIFWRYTSLGSIISSRSAPDISVCTIRPAARASTVRHLGTVFISLLVVAKHRGNIERLVAGTETRLKFPRE
jgi:glycerol-3-phosphate acyltransferase PlsY